MSETIHEYKQVEGGDKCSVCGDSRLSHFFAPPQSEERETLGEDIARLVDKRISKNELVLELVALFHRNNNVMPSQSEERRETCQRCGKTFRIVNTTISCCVLHAPGECCHYGQIEVPSHPDTLRTKIEEIVYDYSGIWVGKETRIERIMKVVAQEKERIDDEWGKAWAELVENTDKETKELRERWENELREEVDSLLSMEFHGIVEPKDFISKARVLTLISNKRKE